MGPDSNPTTPMGASINQGLLCTNMHFITQAQNILTNMSWIMDR